MLVVYEKMGPHRFIGHLDLQRAMQRALRRAGLPVRYSQGFNPHLLLSFAAPLSVGVQGAREVMELPLAREMEEQAFLDRLNAALPEGLKALAARALEEDTPPAMARLQAARYTLKPEEGLEALGQALPGFLAQASIPFEKRGKAGVRQADLRPLIHDLQLHGGALHALLALSEQGSARPDQLLASLCEYAGIPRPRCLITRTALLDKRLLPLEQP